MLKAVREISSSEDYLDVRDVIARFEELEGERENAAGDADEQDAAERDALIAFDESEEGQEYARLKELLDDLSGNGGHEQWRGDWYPITLIRDSYFVEAMQELVSDIGDLPKEIPSYLEIDWEKTARNLRVDYSSVEFDGVTYWYR